jgi:beta-lysine 5,6-aminomutase beta subunit
MSHPNRPWIKPYGDTLDDGRVQAFVHPARGFGSEDSKEAARQLALADGPGRALPWCTAKDMGQGFLLCRLRPAAGTGSTGHHQGGTAGIRGAGQGRHQRVDRQRLGRKMVVVGACIETDAHTVGIDAIMNMKGYNGHKGLESYHEDARHQHGRPGRFAKNWWRAPSKSRPT